MDLVNSGIIFVPQMTLLRRLTFILGSLTSTLTVLLFWIYFSLLMLVCFTIAFLPLGYSYHVVVSVSIDFLSNSKEDTPFHSIVYAMLLVIGMVLVIIWQIFLRVLARPYLMTLYVTFPIHSNFPIRCVLKAIIHRKQWIVSWLLACMWYLMSCFILSWSVPIFHVYLLLIYYLNIWKNLLFF